MIHIHSHHGQISRTGGAQVPDIQDYLRPVLLGEDPRNVERLRTKMYDVMIPLLGQEKAIVAAIGAVDVARRIEELDLFWIEEPVRWHDQPLGLSLVAHGTRIPVAGG